VDGSRARGGGWSVETLRLSRWNGGVQLRFGFRRCRGAGCDGAEPVGEGAVLVSIWDRCRNEPNQGDQEVGTVLLLALVGRVAIPVSACCRSSVRARARLPDGVPQRGRLSNWASCLCSLAGASSSDREALAAPLERGNANCSGESRGMAGRYLCPARARSDTSQLQMTRSAPFITTPSLFFVGLGTLHSPPRW
jgi:hypothetical protein